MDTSASPDFAPRSCPHCGSAHKTILLELTADAIIKSNWSYRSQAAAALGESKVRQFPIVQCKACGFMYAGLLPGAAFVHRLYDVMINAEAARAANLSRVSLAQKMADISVLFRVVPVATGPLRLLDYGCGFGPALEVLRSMSGIQAMGYETSTVRLQDLADRGLAATGDLSEVSKQAPFNVVLLDNVLEHLPAPRETLKFIRSLCKPGAVLYVSVPSISKETIVGQHRIASSGGNVQMDINPWEHLNYFDLEHLDGLLSDFGMIPFGQSHFPDQVNVGLRGSASLPDRAKNAAASILRLCRYVWTGEGLKSVNRRLYHMDEA